MCVMETDRPDPVQTTAVVYTVQSRQARQSGTVATRQLALGWETLLQFVLADRCSSCSDLALYTAATILSLAQNTAETAEIEAVI